MSAGPEKDLEMLTRFLMLASLFTVALFAETVSYPTQNFPFPSPSCFVEFGPCEPIFIPVLQFDPSLGSLNSLTWTLSDFQTVRISIDNDCQPEPPLVSYSFSFTSSSSFLGVTGTETQSGSGTAYGSCSGFQDLYYPATVQLSGSVSDLAPYLGTGVVTTDLEVSSQLAATLDTSAIGGDIFLEDLGGEFTVTYDYTPVPEPRTQTLTVVGCACLLMARRRLHPSKCSASSIGD
jgi:hypothetical protein